MHGVWLKCAIYSNTLQKDTSRLSRSDLFDKMSAPYYLCGAVLRLFIMPNERAGICAGCAGPILALLYSRVENDCATEDSEITEQENQNSVPSVICVAQLICSSL
jgi:hypothetical protein